ncbi:putative hemolysin [Prosthecobacter fusiformis]|uniref:Putative hemolysin n=1 Tax=Prosthecobacter fusiformis TaxID=48464 RepID=A0A4V3FG23_9BACT|nr:GNAT family N-acyltransferase [Prosthecobacter fusiformis]TDU72973.1 putative hemolysin [Prosthecobacter fusiformis]
MILDLRDYLRTPLQRSAYRVLGPLLDRGLGLRGLDEIYNGACDLQKTHPEGQTCHSWFESVLKTMNAAGDVETAADFEFPQSGPLIIIANHPYGILDPVLVAHYAAQHRPEVKVMTNSMLAAFPALRPHIIPVNPFGGEEAARSNLGAMKEAIKHLKAGGALVIFPAGEVAGYKPGTGLQEPVWSTHVGSLVRRSKATVLPVYFPGSNSSLFHAAGLLHPRLRTGLLLREFCNKRNTRVEMRVGSPIAFSKLRKFEDDEALTKYLRIHTFILANRRKTAETAPAIESLDSTRESVLAAEHRERILNEVMSLHERGGRLTGQGNLSVYAAHSHEIPDTLQEIGRLRELTFRAVGEGTGNEVDLDKYDRYYQHLFLWDEDKQQIAGAYRLGRADIILREYGPKGLYTSTLFKFEKPFLAHLESAVEMGRSFIIKEYQRNLSSLPLLWKGIAHWMVRNPGYKKLFGPVSISRDYDSLSQKMMVEFLQGNCLHEDLASFVKPRNPFRYLRTRRLMREFISANLQDVDDCSALISSVETDGKGIPILLKHYLRLSGTILSFNVDKDFSSVIDGLILVDLTETDPKLLAKYMGEENCRTYLARHAAA